MPTQLQHSASLTDDAQFHAHHLNRLIHTLTVPLFQLACVLVLASPWRGLAWAFLGASLALAAILAQKFGHGMEARAPRPFTGPGNALRRILVEPWSSIPRFFWAQGLWCPSAFRPTPSQGFNPSAKDQQS